MATRKNGAGWAKARTLLLHSRSCEREVRKSGFPLLRQLADGGCRSPQRPPGRRASSIGARGPIRLRSRRHFRCLHRSATAFLRSFKLRVRFALTPDEQTNTYLTKIRLRACKFSLYPICQSLRVKWVCKLYVGSKLSSFLNNISVSVVRNNGYPIGRTVSAASWVRRAA